MDQEDVIRILLNAQQRLCAVAYAVVTDYTKSEDLFQDLVIKAIDRVEKFEDEDHLGRWATTVIRNAAIDQVRQSKTRNRILSSIAFERIEERRARVAGDAATDERRDALDLCVDRLAEEERDLLKRRYERGESGDELASALGVSADVIYKRLSRLHRKLRGAMEEELRTGIEGGTIT